MDVWQKLITVNDTHLFCERAGTGESLVLVHGGAGDRRYWDGQFIELAQEFDVIRYDMRGYGKSDFPLEGQVYRHEDDLQALLQALGVSRAHIAGYSLGCQVVVDTYTVYPELFLSIIGVGPYVSGHSSPAGDSLFGGYAECAATFVRAGSNAAADDFLNIAAFNPDRIQAPTRTKLQGICNEYSWWWANHDDPMENVSPVATDLLSNIQVPLLIITAEFDAVVCREVADLLAKEVRLSELVDIPAATHFMLVEKPTEFNRAIAQFLHRVTAITE